MGSVFKDAPAVLSRTMGIAERCNVKLEKVSNPFPKFDVPAGHTVDSYFEHIAAQGMAKRFERIRKLEQQGQAEKDHLANTSSG